MPQCPIYLRSKTAGEYKDICCSSRFSIIIKSWYRMTVFLNNLRDRTNYGIMEKHHYQFLLEVPVMFSAKITLSEWDWEDGQPPSMLDETGRSTAEIAMIIDATSCSGGNRPICLTAPCGGARPAHQGRGWGVCLAPEEAARHPPTGSQWQC